MIKFKANRIRNNGRVIVGRIAKAKRNWLDQFGKDIATEADTILRPGNKPSPAGQPPAVRSGQPNLETFEHVVDVKSDRVKCGPVHLPGKGISPSLPGAFEHGKQVRQRVRSKTRGVRIITKRVRKRPFVIKAAKRALVSFRKNVQEGI